MISRGPSLPHITNHQGTTLALLLDGELPKSLGDAAQLHIRCVLVGLSSAVQNPQTPFKRITQLMKNHQTYSGMFSPTDKPPQSSLKLVRQVQHFQALAVPGVQSPCSIRSALNENSFGKKRKRWLNYVQ